MSLVVNNNVRATTTPISRELDGRDLPDPFSIATRQKIDGMILTSGTGAANVSSRPLFAAAGPSKDDIVQGQVGDCYFLATLAATARTNPNRIRQSVVELGNGT